MSSFDIVMITVFSLSLLRWLITMVAALANYGVQQRRLQTEGLAGSQRSSDQPLVSVVVPAFNEERLVGDTLRSISASDYRALEIILVDDGSTDATAGIVAQLCTQLPQLRLIRQERNKGKAVALTHGAQQAAGTIIVTLDADTRVEPQAIGHLVATMHETEAQAVAGNVKVGNRSNWITRWQALEYVVGLQLERRAQAHLKCITTVPGALGAFRTEALRQAGWFSGDTLAEDTDLTLALHEDGAQISFSNQARAWTEAPVSAKGLLRQRIRWLHGNLQCAFKHRQAFSCAGSNWLKFYGLPSFWFGHLITPLLLPITALYLMRLLEWFSWSQILIGMALLLSIDVATAVVGLGLDREHKRLLPYVPVQRLVYPFFLWIAFISVCSNTLRALFKGRPIASSWHHVERIGGWFLPKNKSSESP